MNAYEAHDRMTLKHVKGTLESILLAINGLEGHNAESLVKAQRKILAKYVEYVASIYLSNIELAKLDNTFACAGWDDQGIRWDNGAKPRAWIVLFTDSSHVRWEYQ